MAQRDNRLPLGVFGCTPPYNGATGRCPVQPSTPTGRGLVRAITIRRFMGTFGKVTFARAVT
jgi:hypothetical protein